MILYTDTSALVKRYLQEEGSPDVVGWMRAADAIGMNVITWVEMAAVLARFERRPRPRTFPAEPLLRQFEADWAGYVRLRVDERTVARAAGLAWQHGLRGYDAVHLASALQWQEYLGERVTLATYDGQLRAVAEKVGLSLLPRA